MAELSDNAVPRWKGIYQDPQSAKGEPRAGNIDIPDVESTERELSFEFLTRLVESAGEER
jgi:hypothetical protein